MAGVSEVIERINDAWRTGRVEELSSLFDPDIVIAGPKHEILARGIEACVASYRDFLRVSVIHEYSQFPVSINAFGPVAIATFGWEMDYEQGGRRSRERGSDLFVLRQQGDEWRAVWRTVNFEAA